MKRAAFGIVRVSRSERIVSKNTFHLCSLVSPPTQTHKRLYHTDPPSSKGDTLHSDETTKHPLYSPLFIKSESNEYPFIPEGRGIPITVGLSGGVDSSVSAFLLKKRGYDVTGVYMKNWDELDELGVCTGEQDWIDAQKVCSKLGIKCKQVDFVKEYWHNVFQRFLEDYRNGRTPNPDVFCNREIKFKEFMNYAMERTGAQYIATGHYARTNFNGESVQLLRGFDSSRDQSYFLSFTPWTAFSRTLFPVGSLSKNQVRQIALDEGIHVAQKKGSTGICFIGERNIQKFLSEYIELQKGKFVDINTWEVLGEHEGLCYYTVGQNAAIGGMKEKMYVCKKDIKEGIVYVCNGLKNPALFCDTCIVDEPNWIVDGLPQTLNDENFEYSYQIRHLQEPGVCKVTKLSPHSETDNRLVVQFNKPQRGVAAGQILVLYHKDVVLCGAIISEPGPSYQEQKRALPDDVHF
eukprot:TRINITY_DN4204_c0_g2_i5.p1 TRINITY_DN4204_c0_g2~~TRINITY_DN4204_c0_g2_i5.p1  ORF type:complete len:463 (+),score=53.49 TRINITY_DN4204_c0_g2_i5:287-1675(+)